MPFKDFRISEKLSNLPTLPLGGLTELQGELKDVTTENYHKLKKQIEKRGLLLPFFVWYDEGTNTNYIEDGHARKKLLVKEGVTLEGLDTFAFDLDEAYLQDMVHFDALKMWEESVANDSGKEEADYDTGEMSEDGEVTCPACGHVF